MCVPIFVDALLLNPRRYAPVPLPRVRISLPSHRIATNSLSNKLLCSWTTVEKIKIDLPVNHLKMIMTAMR